MQGENEMSAKMLLLIDNYDSFTYNLYHYLGELGASCKIVRNDALTVKEALALKPQGVVLSPGPKTPDCAGICLELVEAASRAGLPIFGVCLGMQVIAQVFGGRIVRSDSLFHGKVSEILHDGDVMFSGIPSSFTATRYHSLVVECGSLPPDLNITAETSDGVIMALRHRVLPISGVQFHPESIKTEYGKMVLSNFLKDLDR